MKMEGPRALVDDDGIQLYWAVGVIDIFDLYGDESKGTEDKEVWNETYLSGVQVGMQPDGLNGENVLAAGMVHGPLEEADLYATRQEAEHVREKLDKAVINRRCLEETFVRPVLMKRQ